MSINIEFYWPFDLVNTTKMRTFAYIDPTGVVPSFRSTFYFEPTVNQLICADYDAAGVWQDSWRMVYDPGRGVAEVSDWYPQKNKALSAIFGPVQKQNLKAPILWGNEANIGDVIVSRPAYDPWTSTPPWCASGSGFQSVHFEKLFYYSVDYDRPDVLQFQYAQTWAGKTTGARYWMAKGVGPIAVQWIGYGADGQIIIIEPRMDAIVTEKTWPADNK